MAKKSKILGRSFTFTGALFLAAVPLTGGSYDQSRTVTSAGAVTVHIPPLMENSVYGDISLSDWQWARAQAVREAFEHKQARDAFIANGGKKENFEWQRPQNLLYQANQSNQKLLIIDLGHYDHTESARWPVSNAQASNGMTEAQFVDIQGRALYNEAKRLGYRVVFIRAPNEAMRVPEFNDFAVEDRRSYYARTRGAQIDFIANYLGFSPQNTRAVSLHMNDSDINLDKLYGTAIHVNAKSNISIDFAKVIAGRIDVRAHYVRGSGIEYTTTLALPKAAENIPTILFESEYMSDHPIAVERRRHITNDNGASWARWFMRGVENSFPRAPQTQTQMASNAAGVQSQYLR